MDWYYIHDGQQAGPVSETEFQSLVHNREITSDTYVWREGMAEWQAYSAVAWDTPEPMGSLPELELAPMEPAPVAQAPTAYSGMMQTCAECGRPFPIEEMIKYNYSYVCAACKPLFIQRLKEGAVIRGHYVYGGFWIRFGAKFIDGIILAIINVALMLLGGELTHPGSALSAFTALLRFVVSIGYVTYFIGKYSATPGKMACGLVVITPEGEQVSYLRAFARYWAEFLSSLILGIGYIMAGFDDEKRALHDRICNTRVVYKYSVTA